MSDRRDVTEQPTWGYWDVLAKPLCAALGVTLILHVGGANWWLSGAAGYALLNVLWTIWKVVVK